MADFTPPEGMVPCEVGPVEIEPVWPNRYRRVIGHLPTRFGIKVKHLPVYRFCDANGEWV